MIPGSLESGEPLGFLSAFRDFKVWIKRYFWLWIAYQTLKGITTTTVIWVPLAYMYFK
ncbi:hypothetical protein [Kaistia terrae]|uniref:Uncharacterized protein n=1 Tax=Kaistia terrae TaxID=537017 RepID=A0ABW0PXZ4_9HYPH|nr:hypothetical protein [Kaistia terrae]MCX5581652.1 hypothetical protein [Kaistia terrae]